MVDGCHRDPALHTHLAACAVSASWKSTGEASRPDTASVLRSLSLLTVKAEKQGSLGTLSKSPVSFLYILLVESLLEQKEYSEKE